MKPVHSNYLFNKLDYLSHGKTPQLIPPRVQYNVLEIEKSVEGVLAGFLMPILPNITGELTRESHIDIHWLINGNMAYVASNIGGIWNGHHASSINAEDYL